MTTPPDPCHHAEHQSQGQACLCQSPAGSTYGHMEPDPGPLGLHSVEEGCSQENIHVAPELLGPKVSFPTLLAAQYAPQLSGEEQVRCGLIRLSLFQ